MKTMAHASLSYPTILPTPPSSLGRQAGRPHIFQEHPGHCTAVVPGPLQPSKAEGPPRE